ncbi:uncharacterized protein [Littorina saxatilis]|uniref:uncharacterized protein n=1 Tax=Littorina saxatilis TaxID=31220 RepID=UPI0038B4BC1B
MLLCCPLKVHLQVPRPPPDSPRSKVARSEPPRERSAFTAVVSISGTSVSSKTTTTSSPASSVKNYHPERRSGLMTQPRRLAANRDGPASGSPRASKTVHPPSPSSEERNTSPEKPSSPRIQARGLGPYETQQREGRRVSNGTAGHLYTDRHTQPTDEGNAYGDQQREGRRVSDGTAGHLYTDRLTQPTDEGNTYETQQRKERRVSDGTAGHLYTDRQNQQTDEGNVYAKVVKTGAVVVPVLRQPSDRSSEEYPGSVPTSVPHDQRSTTVPPGRSFVVNPSNETALSVPTGASSVPAARSSSSGGFPANEMGSEFRQTSSSAISPGGFPSTHHPAGKMVNSSDQENAGVPYGGGVQVRYPGFSTTPGFGRNLANTGQGVHSRMQEGEPNPNFSGKPGTGQDLDGAKQSSKMMNTESPGYPGISTLGRGRGSGSPVFTSKEGQLRPGVRRFSKDAAERGEHQLPKPAGQLRFVNSRLPRANNELLPSKDRDENFAKSATNGLTPSANGALSRPFDVLGEETHLPGPAADQKADSRQRRGMPPEVGRTRDPHVTTSRSTARSVPGGGSETNQGFHPKADGNVTSPKGAALGEATTNTKHAGVFSGRSAVNNDNSTNAAQNLRGLSKNALPTCPNSEVDVPSHIPSHRGYGGGCEQSDNIANGISKQAQNSTRLVNRTPSEGGRNANGGQPTANQRSLKTLSPEKVTSSAENGTRNVPVNARREENGLSAVTSSGMTQQQPLNFVSGSMDLETQLSSDEISTDNEDLATAYDDRLQVSDV